MIEELDPHITPQLDHSALLVIDTQVDFVDDGTFPVPGTTQVVPAITRLIRAYRTTQLPIVHVIRLYDGADVLLGGECQAPAGQEWAMWKPRWGAFHRTPLDHHLRSLEVPPGRPARRDRDTHSPRVPEATYAHRTYVPGQTVTMRVER